MKKETVYRVFSHLPTLETDRLILRRMAVTDAEDMFAYAKNEETTSYLTWYPHRDVNYTREYLRYIGQRYRVGSFYDWALEWKQDHRMIGTCGFTSFDFPNNRGEIGYVINPAYRGQGIAPEACRAVMTFGFTELGLHRIEARYITGNDASEHVMEKLGMKPEGVSRGAMLIKGQYRDIGICAILRDEFLAGKKSE